MELIGYLGPDDPGARIRAIPGTGTEVPVTILGSSLYGAQLAAYLGLPYAFAAHFAPAMLDEAVAVYRASYRPSPRHPHPYFLLCAGLYAAETDAEAVALRSSVELAFANLRTGRAGPLPRPDPAAVAALDPAVLAQVAQALSCSVTGGPDAVRRGMAALVARVRPDEIILTAQIHDHAARLHAYRLGAEVLGDLAAAA
jgi:luciferase family oxidoreductase group 1